MSATRLCWRIHHWVGLKLMLLLAFVLLTGTLAVVAHEIDWLLRPALRVDPATVTATDVDWVAVARTVAATEPHARLITLSAPVDPWFAAVAVVARPVDGSQSGERRLGFAYLHPTSGALLGTGHWVTVQRVLRNLHRHLMLPTRYGVPLVSSLSLALVALLCTSVVIYKRWWRGFLRAPRLEHPRRAWGDVHRLAGVWTLWFLLLIAATGLWYLIESLGGAAPRIGPPAAPGCERTVAETAALLPASLVAAQRVFPGLRIERIVFPSATADEFRFEGQYRAVLVRPRANVVVVDPQSAIVRAVVDARSLSLHQRISEMADPLHFGTFGGLWTKLLWFVLGGLLTASAITGAAIYSLRIGARASSSSRQSPLARVWLGMGWLRWPCAALIVVGCLLLPNLARQ